MDLYSDKRTVMTLDAGGTNFVFSALKAGDEIFEPLQLPAFASDLKKSISSLKKGFEEIMLKLQEAPLAISFAFPGPADYPAGIIGDLPNLPAFRGGVPLGPILSDAFNIPVFINNDGDLFTYGEALGGFLPEVNSMLEEAGNPRRYQNLVGLTLGTGFGCGIYTNGKLLIGDNSIAGEVWLTSNRITPDRNAEEGVSIRSVIRNYLQYTGKDSGTELSPKDIFDIAEGISPGSAEAARRAFEDMGRHLGDAMANLITLTDGLVVLGGGIAGASKFFMPAAMNALNGHFEYPADNPLPRLVQQVCYLDDEKDKKLFLEMSGKEIEVAGTGRTLYYDKHPKSAVSISRLGTSRSISLGAYAFALSKLNEEN